MHFPAVGSNAGNGTDFVSRFKMQRLSLLMLRNPTRHHGRIIMPTWLFALVVLGIGLGIALFVDRLKARPGSNIGELRPQRERSKWLYYWFLGRFPTEKEEKEEKEDEKGRSGGKNK
jgi:hypothetical protein